MYCLSVPDLHCFSLNNGVIVSNCADEAALLLMARPVRFMPEVEKKVNRPPADITEIARLEREQIWEEVKASDEYERSLYEWA